MVGDIVVERVRNVKRIKGEDLVYLKSLYILS